MHTVELTEQNFSKHVAKGIVLVDFWASWCGPCRAFAPVFEAAAARHSDIVFGKVDTEAQPRLAAAFKITSIPTLLVFRDGMFLAGQPGALPARVLDDVIQKIRALDMTELKKNAQPAETRI